MLDLGFRVLGYYDFLSRRIYGWGSQAVARAYGLGAPPGAPASFGVKGLGF